MKRGQELLINLTSLHFDLMAKLPPDLQPVGPEAGLAASIYGQAVEEITYLREVLQRIADHDPSTPGLQFDTMESLLSSAIGTARSAL